ncbi:MAG: vitamin K epoxide reductase family protein [Granulicella sp.]
MKYVLALLALAGLYVSIIALRVHNQDPSQAPPCAVTERFDCGAVNHSRFSVFPARTFDEAPNAGHHIPVATLGIIAYSTMAILALLGRYWLLLIFSEIGFFMAGFLSYLEAFVIEKWCIYCLWSQGIVTAIFLLTAITLLLRWRNGLRKSALDRKLVLPDLKDDSNAITDTWR